MRNPAAAAAALLALCTCPLARAGVAEIIPPGEEIKRDRPRLLLRPGATPHAISLGQLKALKRDADFQAALEMLKREKSAASQAMVWLLTGEEAAVDRVIDRIRKLDRVPPDSAFDVWFGMRELSLAYDWLYDHPKFTEEVKKEIRGKAFELADKWGVKEGDDHVFHNYTWMNNCGLALWAMACYGDDPRAEELMKTVRFRLNQRMFPAMEHLDGHAGDAMGYWYVYCSGSCIWTLMAVQSAYDIDAAGIIREKQHNWLARQLEAMIQGTLPDMRFMPWGDMQGGPDGGATKEMAGVTDAATWATKSPPGAHFSKWLAGKLGMKRFRRDTAILYLLYNRHPATGPAEPPLAMLAGGEHSGQAMMRSSWKDDATVVGFRCSDYYQGHFHHDAGSFVIYRNGLLAVDAGKYTLYTKELRAPIIATSAHNSLLLGGEGQRVVKGQWYKDLAEFNEARRNPDDGLRLEFGDVPFYRHAGEWTAVAGQFAQAYRPGLVASCVRQLLYVRPGTVVIVDSLVAPAGRKVPEVTWMLQLPTAAPKVGRGSAEFSNGRSWLRCRDLLSDAEPGVGKSPPTQITSDYRKLADVSRVSFLCKEQPETVLVHLIEVGDGQPGAPREVKPRVTAESVETVLDGKTYVFSRKAPFAVSAGK
jgi:hypothetical protein